MAYPLFQGIATLGSLEYVARVAMYSGSCLVVAATAQATVVAQAGYSAGGSGKGGISSAGTMKPIDSGGSPPIASLNVYMVRPS